MGNFFSDVAQKLGLSKGPRGSSGISKEQYADVKSLGREGIDTAWSFANGGLGSSPGDMENLIKPLLEQMGRLDAAGGMLEGLPGELARSAIGSTAGGSMAAVNAARMAGGGNVLGGNPAAIAARGAADSAVGQSSALANAIVQARLGQANFKSGLLGQQSGISSAMSQAYASLLGVKEDRIKTLLQMYQGGAQSLAGAGGTAAGTEQSEISSPRHTPLGGLGI